MRKELQAVRNGASEIISNIYSEAPEFERGRLPNAVVADLMAFVRGEQPGTEAPGAGEIEELTNLWFSVPDAFIDEEGFTDWKVVEAVQTGFMEWMQGYDPQMAERLAFNTQRRYDHPLEELYIQTQSAVTDYYDLVPEGAPDTGATWFQYQYPWLLENPQAEALMFIFGYRQSVLTQEAADIVHQLAPGQDVTIRQY